MLRRLSRFDRMPERRISVNLVVLDGHRVLRLLFEVRQVQIFEDQLGDLVDVYFGFVVFLARLIACARALSGRRADLRGR